MLVGCSSVYWKSIKSLRVNNSRKKKKRKRSNDSDSPKNSEDETETKYPDILEIWCIIALHTLYIRSGAEAYLSYIPFYFYVKMIALAIFFFLPSSHGGNVPACYLFENIVIKSVDYVHEYLFDFDYISFTKKQLKILPWRLIDLFFPGTLILSPNINSIKLINQRRALWFQRKEEIELAMSTNPFYLSSNNYVSPSFHSPMPPTSPLPTTPSPITRSSSPKKIKSIVRKSSYGMNNSPKSASSTSSSQKRKVSFQIDTTTPSPSMTQPASTFTPVSQRKLKSSSLHLKQFSRTHPQHTNRYSSPATMQSAQSPSRTKKQNNTSPQQKRPSIESPRQTAKSRALALANRNNFMSPTESIITRRRRRKNPKKRTVSSPDNSSKSKDNDQKKTVLSSVENISNRKSSSSSKKIISDDSSTSFSSPNIKLQPLTPPSTVTKIRNALSRKSIGNALRSVVAGDSNIRLRDFLFDLDLIPGSPGGGGGVETPLTDNGEEDDLSSNNENIDDSNISLKKSKIPQQKSFLTRKDSNGSISSSSSISSSPVRRRRSSNIRRIDIAERIDFDQEKDHDIPSSSKSPSPSNKRSRTSPRNQNKDDLPYYLGGRMKKDPISSSSTTRTKDTKQKKNSSSSSLRRSQRISSL